MTSPASELGKLSWKKRKKGKTKKQLSDMMRELAYKRHKLDKPAIPNSST